MMRGLAIALAALLATGSAARAVDVVATDFQVAVTHGAQTWYRTTTVPYLPDQSCYYWWVQVSDPLDMVAYTETLHLPAPAQDWGDDTSGLDISKDGMTVSRDDEPKLDKGWFGGGWCLVEGDPVGRYTLDVTVDGEVVHTFTYVVVEGNENHMSPDQLKVHLRQRG